MKKNIALLCLTIALLPFSSCSDKSSSPAPTGESGHVWQIPGCVSDYLFKASSVGSDFDYQFKDMLIVNLLLEDNCTSDSLRFAVSQAMSNDTIHVIAVDTASINARCRCNYLVHAEFINLPLDKYFFVCTRIDNGVETTVCARYLYREGRSPNEAVIYSNSFESSADTAGWTGYGMMVISGDVPPGGGSRSLRVSGACLVPHAAYNIGVMPETGRYILRFWGKNLMIGGGVGLSLTEGLTPGIGVEVQDSTWTFYQSDDTLYCPAGGSLWLNMTAGGIVSSAMLVDLVQVVRVD